MMRAVFFDIGETLINETRPWSLLADLLEVPRMTLFGTLGAIIAEGRDHRDVFDIVRPDLGWQAVVERFSNETCYLPEDLYPDAMPTLQALKDQGYFVGVVGNQPAEREPELCAMNLPADLVATSAGWGLKKPDPGFFDRIAQVAGCAREEIAYVGDRVDNDVVPVAAAGMVPIHIVRGAWGYIQQSWPQAALARAQVRSLSEVLRVMSDLSGKAPASSQGKA